jgi:hypothetical protein
MRADLDQPVDLRDEPLRLGPRSRDRRAEPLPIRGLDGRGEPEPGVAVGERDLEGLLERRQHGLGRRGVLGEDPAAPADQDADDHGGREHEPESGGRHPQFIGRPPDAT